MNDVDRRTRHFRQRNGARGGFGFGRSRTSESVILGRRLAFGQSLLHDHVDGAAVFGVHADHRAGAAGHAQGFEDAAVIEHENAGIRHEELETGDAVADELFHFLKARIGKIGDDAMEAVVGDSFRGCLLHPCVECGAQRLAFVLDREVDESGGTAECGCAGAGLEIIRARSAAERHVQVCVDVNPAGEDVFAGHIEDTPGVFARQAAADGDDLAVLNGKVGLVSICGSGHGPVGNDSVESHSRPLWCWDRGRSVLESRHYLYQFRSGRERRMNFGITIKPDLEVAPAGLGGLGGLGGAAAGTGDARRGHRQHPHAGARGGGVEHDDAVGVDPALDELVARLLGRGDGAGDAAAEVDRDDVTVLLEQRLVDGEEIADRRL